MERLILIKFQIRKLQNFQVASSVGLIGTGEIINQASVCVWNCFH